MKEKLLKRMVLISAAVFFVGVVLCFLIFNVINIVNAKNTVDSVSAEYTSRFSGAATQEELSAVAESVDSALLRVSVLSSDGNLIADNLLDADSDIRADEGLIADVVENGSAYRLQRLYGEGETLFLIYSLVPTETLDPEGYMIAVYGVDTDFNDFNFWILAGACFAGWAVITLITYVLMKNYLTSATEPLGRLRAMLENVNKGNYSDIGYSSKYRDVQDIVDNIDVAARKVSDTINELKSEQRKNSFILSNVAQGIVAVNSRRKIIISNDAFSRIFGSTPGLVGVDLGAVIGAGEALDSVYAAIDENRLGTVADLEREGRIYRVDNAGTSGHWLESWGEPGAMLLFTDVTTEVNLNKMRSEFFDNASHELKSPLTAIAGYAELLEDKELPEPKRRKCVAEIRENAAAMLELINDMLKLSKLDSGTKARNVTEVDLGALCDGVIKRFEVQADEMKLEFSREGEASLECDEKEMYAMVSNLVSNAVKYNKKGGSVRIELAQTENAVSLSVEDTGVGIAPEYRDRVFERFFKIDTARTRSRSLSTGLGLAIVKQLADAYGAKIKLESEVGKGTRITLVFGRKK